MIHDQIQLQERFPLEQVFLFVLSNGSCSIKMQKVNRNKIFTQIRLICRKRKRNINQRNFLNFHTLFIAHECFHILSWTSQSNVHFRGKVILPFITVNQITNILTLPKLKTQNQYIIRAPFDSHFSPSSFQPHTVH